MVGLEPALLGTPSAEKKLLEVVAWEAEVVRRLLRELDPGEAVAWEVEVEVVRKLLRHLRSLKPVEVVALEVEAVRKLLRDLHSLGPVEEVEKLLWEPA